MEHSPFANEIILSVSSSVYSKRHVDQTSVTFCSSGPPVRGKYLRSGQFV